MLILISLNDTDYTWKNALLWGNCTSHAGRVLQGPLKGRVVHAIIAVLEAPPIIGQIISIFEMVIVTALRTKFHKIDEFTCFPSKSGYIHSLLAELAQTQSFDQFIEVVKRALHFRDKILVPKLKNAFRAAFDDIHSQKEDLIAQYLKELAPLINQSDIEALLEICNQLILWQRSGNLIKFIQTTVKGLQNGTTLKDVPSVPFEIILSYLNDEEAVNLRLTSKAVRKRTQDGMKQKIANEMMPLEKVIKVIPGLPQRIFNFLMDRELTAVNLQGTPKTTKILLSSDLDLSFITKLSLRTINAVDFSKLSRLSLKSFSAGVHNMTDDSLLLLQELPLTSLSLTILSGSVTDVGFACLKNMPLEQLTFKSTLAAWGVIPVTNSGLTTLRELPLRSLYLGGFRGITDDALSVVSELPLTRFTLEDCPLITSNGMAYLSNLPLRHLSLRYQHIPDDGFAHFGKLPLESLEVVACLAITEGCFDFIKHLKLSTINLRFCFNVRGAALRFFSNMPLTTLYIEGGKKVNDSDLEYLRDLPIVDLTLIDCRDITDAGIAHLKDLPLRHLKILYSPWVTNKQMEQFTH